jgi:hypothetical protein
MKTHCRAPREPLSLAKGARLCDGPPARARDPVACLYPKIAPGVGDPCTKTFGAPPPCPLRAEITSHTAQYPAGVTLLHAYARTHFPELAYTAVALSLFVSHNSDEEASAQSSRSVLDRSHPATPGLASGPPANPSTHAHGWVDRCLRNQAPCTGPPAPLSTNFPVRDFALDPRREVENSSRGDVATRRSLHAEGGPEHHGGLRPVRGWPHPQRPL